MDLGLGNGLRNKLSIAIAREESVKIKELVSTTYVLIFIILIGIAIIFFMFYPFINWSLIFNSPENLDNEINKLVSIVVILYLFEFFFNIINSIFYASQQPFYIKVINLLSNILIVFGLLILNEIDNNSLLLLGIISKSSPVVILIFATIWSYKWKFKKFRPSIKYFEKKHIKSLLSLSFQFFFMSLAYIVLFTSDNLMITQLFGPEDVTPYTVANKYMSIIFIGFKIVTTPLWSSFTEAEINKDYQWIRITIRKYVYIWLLLVLVSIVLIVISKYVYSFWIGQNINIPLRLTTFCAIFVLLTTFANIYTSFLNGINRIKLSLILSFVTMTTNIPLSIFLAKHMGLGITGIIIGSCLSISLSAILKPIQTYYIIKNERLS